MVRSDACLSIVYETLSPVMFSDNDPAFVMEAIPSAVTRTLCAALFDEISRDKKGQKAAE